MQRRGTEAGAGERGHPAQAPPARAARPLSFNAMSGKVRDAVRVLKREIRVLRLVLRDRRTPPAARVLLWLSVGYTLLPFDIIPDFIPVIGHLDDAVIVPILVLLALRMVPPEVLEECRARSQEA